MISLAKDSQAPRLGRHTVFFFRAVLAFVWLYSGIRAGTATPEIVGSANSVSLADTLGLTNAGFALVFGGILVAVALWTLSGWAIRACVIVQLLLVFFVWWLRYEDGSRFLDSVVYQAPMILLILMLWGYGPGSFAWTRKRGRASTWTRG